MTSRAASARMTSTSTARPSWSRRWSPWHENSAARSPRCRNGGPNLSIDPIDGEALDDAVLDQAAQLEQLLPVVMRQLFTADPAHPVTDLPFGQFRLCVLLHQRGKRTMSHLGDELGISVSAVTQMADRLER